MPNTTTPNREAVVKLIADDIQSCLTDWQEGRACSPDQLDYVLGADRILTTTNPNYIGSTEEGRQFLADEIYEDAGETYTTVEEIAAHIYDVLTAE